MKLYLWESGVEKLKQSVIEGKAEEADSTELLFDFLPVRLEGLLTDICLDDLYKQLSILWRKLFLTHRETIQFNLSIQQQVTLFPHHFAH
jgi:hypothetical protein